MKKISIICAAAAAFCGATLCFAGDNMTGFALCSLAAGIMANNL